MINYLDLCIEYSKELDGEELLELIQHCQVLREKD